MITQELLDSPKSKDILGEKDLDTRNFILSLYESDSIDISEAFTYLQNYISINTPIEELALIFIAHNFQYYKEADDTIIYDLGLNNVYYEILNHSTLGYYALLKEFMPPYTTNWELKQIKTYKPKDNTFEERDIWVTKRESISLEWSNGARILATTICNKFDQKIASINNQLYRKLDRENLALFFDVEEFETSSGYEDYNGLKDILL